MTINLFNATLVFLTKGQRPLSEVNELWICGDRQYRLNIEFFSENIGDECLVLKIHQISQDQMRRIRTRPHSDRKISTVRLTCDSFLGEGIIVPSVEKIEFLFEDKLVASWIFNGKNAFDHFEFLLSDQ